jgi:hypothetical protein
MADKTTEVVAVKDLLVGDRVKVDDGTFVALRKIEVAAYMDFGSEKGFHLEYSYQGEPAAAIAGGDEMLERLER